MLKYSFVISTLVFIILVKPISTFATNEFRHSPQIPVKPTVNTATINTTIPHNELIEFPVHILFDQATLDHYPTAPTFISEFFDQLNFRLEQSNINRRFIYSGSYEVFNKSEPSNCVDDQVQGFFFPNIVCETNNNKAILVVEAWLERDAWSYAIQASSVVIWREYPRNIFSDSPFDKEVATDIFIHEFGHLLGIPDLYILNVYKFDNKVNNESYTPFVGDIMNDTKISGQLFGEYAKNIAHRSYTLPPDNLVPITDLPVEAILKTTGSNFCPISNVDIKVYKSVYNYGLGSSMFYTYYFTYLGKTNSTGEIMIKSHDYANFNSLLVEMKKYNQTKYSYLNTTDFNFAEWKNPNSIPTFTLSTNFECESTTLGDFNNDNVISSEDLVILSTYLFRSIPNLTQGGDINNDSKTNLVDLIFLTKLL